MNTYRTRRHKPMLMQISMCRLTVDQVREIFRFSGYEIWLFMNVLLVGCLCVLCTLMGQHAWNRAHMAVSHIQTVSGSSVAMHCYPSITDSGLVIEVCQPA